MGWDSRWCCLLVVGGAPWQRAGRSSIGRRVLQQVTKACKAVRRVVQVAADKMCWRCEELMSEVG